MNQTAMLFGMTIGSMIVTCYVVFMTWRSLRWSREALQKADDALEMQEAVIAALRLEIEYLRGEVCRNSCGPQEDF